MIGFMLLNLLKKKRFFKCYFPNFLGHSFIRKWMLLSNPKDKGGGEEVVSVVILVLIENTSNTRFSKEEKI